MQVLLVLNVEVYLFIYLACKEKIKKGTIRVGRMEVAEDGYSKGKCIS